MTESRVAAHRLRCVCLHCKTENAPFKVEYLFGDIILLNAICAKCEGRYWIQWDLVKLQMAQDEKEVIQIKTAMDELAAFRTSDNAL